ncbi:hypothetical protein AAG906_000585 [Vitis piasezkii]
MLHGQSEVVPPVMAQTTVSEDQIRQIRMLDSSVTWDDSDGILVANLPAEFRMSEIDRYTGIGCPRIHLKLYSTIMRAYGLDETQLIVLFPLSLSDSFPIDSKENEPSGEQRLDISTISPTRRRTLRRHQSTSHAARGYSPYSRYQYRQPGDLLPPFPEPTSTVLHFFYSEDITMFLSIRDAIEPDSWEAHGCVTFDPVIAHSTHVVPSSTVSIPSIDHDTESEPIILDERSHGGY